VDLTDDEGEVIKDFPLWCSAIDAADVLLFADFSKPPLHGETSIPTMRSTSGSASSQGARWRRSSYW
jgi:hypothetical protein